MFTKQTPFPLALFLANRLSDDPGMVDMYAGLLTDGLKAYSDAQPREGALLKRKGALDEHLRESSDCRQQARNDFGTRRE
jgi:hypothetical protein